MNDEGQRGAGPQGPQQQGPGEGGPRGEREEKGCDHLDYTTGLWEKAFWQALHEVRVDLLKEKIKSSWGKNMEETSGKVLEAAHEGWKKFSEVEAEKEKTREESAYNRIKAWIKEALKKGPQ